MIEKFTRFNRWLDNMSDNERMSCTIGSFVVVGVFMSLPAALFYIVIMIVLRIVYLFKYYDGE